MRFSVFSRSVSDLHRKSYCILMVKLQETMILMRKCRGSVNSYAQKDLVSIRVRSVVLLAFEAEKKEIDCCRLLSAHSRVPLGGHSKKTPMDMKQPVRLLVVDTAQKKLVN